MQGNTLSLSPSEKERQEQIKEAKRLSMLDITETASKPTSGAVARTDALRVVPIREGARQQDKVKKQPYTPKGHDGILKDLQRHKAEVYIEFMDGRVESGTIVASDRYTISLRLKEVDAPYDDIEHFYKHSIRSFGKYKEVAKHD